MSDTPIKKVTRKGAGRTKGSFSFVKVTLDQLRRYNSNPDFYWLVSRKQAEMMGMKDLVTDRIGDLKESIAGTSVKTAPEVKSEEF